MRRFLIVAILFVKSFSSTIVFAHENQVTVSLGGVLIEFQDAQPFIDDNNQLQVPIAMIAKNMNIKTDWDSATNTAIFKSESLTAKIKIGENKIHVKYNSGTENIVEMDTVATIKDGRTFVPISYVANISNIIVSWNSVTKKAELVKFFGTSYSNRDIMKIGTVEELNDYLKKNEVVTINKDKYRETYFKDNFLLLFPIYEAQVSTKVKILSVNLTDKSINIDVFRQYPKDGIGLDAILQYQNVFKLNRKFIDKEILVTHSESEY